MWQNQFPRMPGGGQFWLFPVMLGLLLIVFGILIFAIPMLLEFIVAAVLFFAGCSLIGVGWHLRSRVTYRRMDDNEPDSGGFGGQA